MRNAPTPTATHKPWLQRFTFAVPAHAPERRCDVAQREARGALMPEAQRPHAPVAESPLFGLLVQ